MPASNKTLANQQKKKNKEAGIGDADGRLPSRVKKDEVMLKCTICSQEIRETAKNVEAQQHASAKHPKATYQECFPAAKN